MSRPSDEEIDDVVAELGKLLKDAKTLGRRMKAANRADRRGGTPRSKDGFPSSSGSGAGPTNHVGRPTEAAMLADYRTARRITDDDDGGPGGFVARTDVMRENVEHAWGYLQQTLHSLKACIGRLDLIDGLGDTAVEPERCESCARAQRSAAMRNYSAVSKGGVDLLDRAWRLCGWCYDWVYRHGKLPTVEQVVRHHTGKAVYDDTTTAATAGGKAKKKAAR
jgi:hypothetical protein